MRRVHRSSFAKKERSRAVGPGPFESFSAEASAYQPLVFQPMKDRVKHAIGPLQLLMGMGLDLLDDGVTVGFALGEEGEDERFGGGGDEFLTNHRGNMHRVYMYVKPRRLIQARTSRKTREKAALQTGILPPAHAESSAFTPGSRSPPRHPRCGMAYACNLHQGD